MKDRTLRERLEQKKSALIQERSSFLDHWRLCSQFVKPRKGRFDSTDRNKGDRRNQKIINGIAAQAHGVARAGMMSGAISQTKPWFDMVTEDPDLREIPAVQEWTAAVKRVMYRVFRESNFYEMAQNTIGELLIFGTGSMSQMEDFQNIARFYSHTIGSYAIAQNNRHKVDTWVHEYEWQTEQVIREFGWNNVSRAIQDAYSTGNYAAWWRINHLICPNDEYDPTAPVGAKKLFKSCYWENSEERGDKLLREGGFDEFPVYVPRWDVTGEDIYGTDCPTMTALGDIMGLQTKEKEKAKGIQKMVTPPLKGPASLRTQPVSSLPGHLTVYDGEGQNQLQSIYDVRLPIGELRQDISDDENRINRAYYVHLFRAISDMDGIQPRNELDLTQRDQERLLELGPVISRLSTDFLDNCLDRTFNQVMRANEASGGRIVPPVPAELSEQALKWEYIGTLAMAQKRLETGPLERTLAFAGNIATAKNDPGVWDKIDTDQAIDEYAQSNGVSNRVIVPDEIVGQIRQAREQAAAKQMQLAGANSVADTAQKVAGAVKQVRPAP
jgi:hypothetical protein